MHTKGKWKIEYNRIVGEKAAHTNGKQRNSLGISSASYSKTVATIFGALDLPTPKANAHLIAAAPQLLEACEEAYEQSHNPIIEKILLTAIAAAKEGS